MFVTREVAIALRLRTLCAAGSLIFLACRAAVLLGPPGVGKTHLAISLGVLVAEIGHRIYFTTAIELARRMAKAMAENRLTREINSLVRPKLLVLDEVGHLSLEPAHASLLFQAISERYERRQPIVLTSNKAFSEWGQVFAGDPIMASAALDRLLHRSTVINIRGESYRLKEKRQARAASTKEVPQEVPRASELIPGGQFSMLARGSILRAP